jgi:hypothetical protein
VSGGPFYRDVSDVARHTDSTDLVRLNIDDESEKGNFRFVKEMVTHRKWSLAGRKIWTRWTTKLNTVH